MATISTMSLRRQPVINEQTKLICSSLLLLSLGVDAVVGQNYQVHVHDEYVLLGNAGLLRCLVPSFVSDFVLIDGWLDDTGTEHMAPNQPYGSYPLF